MLEELQRLLEASDLTHKEISELTGVSISTLQGIKSGRKPNPTIDTYQALIRLLKAGRKKPSPDSRKPKLAAKAA